MGDHLAAEWQRRQGRSTANSTHKWQACTWRKPGTPLTGSLQKPPGTLLCKHCLGNVNCACAPYPQRHRNDFPGSSNNNKQKHVVSIIRTSFLCRFLIPRYSLKGRILSRVLCTPYVGRVCCLTPACAERASTAIVPSTVASCV